MLLIFAQFTQFTHRILYAIRIHKIFSFQLDQFEKIRKFVLHKKKKCFINLFTLNNSKSMWYKWEGTYTIRICSDFSSAEKKSQTIQEK